MKWTETRSVLEKQSVESLPPEREEQQATHEENVKGHDTLATITSPLKLLLDPIPVLRAERFSGPERDQLATPWTSLQH